MVVCRHDDWSMLTFVHLVEHVTVLNTGKRCSKVTDCKIHLITARTANV